MITVVHPLTQALAGTLAAPASKSYAQRALAAALLVPEAEGESILEGMSLCNDTVAALEVIQHLGARVSVEPDGTTYRVQGGFLRSRPTELNIGESGLAARLFTPIAAQSPQPITLTGHGSILQRPLNAMERPLLDLGAAVTLTNDRFLPLTVSGPFTGGQVEVDGSSGSQFITGLLTSLPLSPCDTKLQVHSPTSLPYIEMTIEVLRAFGVEIGIGENYETFYIKGNQQYRATEYLIEGDWSAASCLLVAGAVAGRITLEDLNPASLQADRAILDVLVQAGANLDFCDNKLTVRPAPLVAFEFDATHAPDLFPALVLLAAFCRGRSVIRGTDRLTHKESDRAKTLAAEFAKLGVTVDISQPNQMFIEGLGADFGATLAVADPNIHSHNDHRIAMATAIAALRADQPITIHEAEAVDKSYPNFWKDLYSLTH